MFSKTVLPVLALVGSLAWLDFSTPAPVRAPKPTVIDLSKTWDVDGPHSSVMFRIKHVEAAWFFGAFNRISGSFRLDRKNVSASSVEVKVDAKTVDGGNKARNGFLKNILKVKEFPHITFKSSKVEALADNRFKVTGNLTFFGKTKPVTFEAEHTGTASINERLGPRCGFLAEIDIKRSDYGFTWGLTEKELGDDVKLIVSLEGRAPKG